MTSDSLRMRERRAFSGLSGLGRAIWWGLKPVTFMPAVPTHERIRYLERRRRGVAPVMDIYLPSGDAPPEGHPSVVLVHGGAFIVGSRSMKAIRYTATRLVQSGFAVAVPDYRLLLRGGALTAQREDVREAAAFWIQWASNEGLDVRRIHLAGLSAGAALALLEAAENPQAYRSFTGIYGVYDFAGLEGLGRRWLKRRLTGSTDPGRWAELSPLQSASDLPMPVFVAHGERDRLVPVVQTQALVSRRSEAGRPTTARYFPGMPHGWLNEGALPQSAALLDAMVRFLD